VIKKSFCNRLHFLDLHRSVVRACPYIYIYVAVARIGGLRAPGAVPTGAIQGVRAPKRIRRKGHYPHILCWVNPNRC
jgi:hypothetical protein